MIPPIQFPGEDRSNAARNTLTRSEPIALRTFTPSQAVLARSAGAFHFTPEGRRLYDYSSGVLVANLGHNPHRWMHRFGTYMGWKPEHISGGETAGYFEAVTMTAYNAATEIEAQAVERLLRNVQASPGGGRCEQVMWAASGSEAIQKALWACLHRDESRDIIVATRYGFHGKKGLAGAVTGCETDRDRDPRVKFISFPRSEYDDLSKSDHPFDPALSRAELDALTREYGRRINCLITEPYLGGGGSFHPPAAYHHLLQDWCRANDVVFILDEVQANFGRTGKMYAFEKYGIEPDIVCLGKGLGNGVPVSAAVGRADLMATLKYGEASDTWSANPLACAAVLATLDEFENSDVLSNAAKLNAAFVRGLMRLKETPVVAKVRGEGMVFGVECATRGNRTSNEVANDVVEACYLGRNGTGIHLLGPLSGNVLRVSPPLTMTEDEARESLDLFSDLVDEVGKRIQS
ncbi:MAG: aspartate aminotransferase family protein [Planctomycetaceae bacterium]|nr:aspartate aminotransferase family protein [Planctomycetaceae bacterium]